MDAQSGSALPRTRVRIVGLANLPPVALTDEHGGFEFTGLPPGRFFLNAEKSGYGVGQYPEPGLTLRGGNRPLMVAEHETVADVVIPMYRGAAISGRVVDAYGDAMENAQVQAFRVPSRGRGTPMPRWPPATTNDLGEFRLGRLEPGSYVVAVHPRYTHDVASGGQPVPTYFPNAASLAEAQPILVGRAQTVSGIEIVVGEAVSTVVSGTVLDPDGRPVSGFISVRRMSSLMQDFGGGGTRILDGAFKMYLPVGEYELEAHANRDMMRSAKPGEELFGVLPVSVTGAPLSDLNIQLAPGAVISGRIVFDGQTPPPDDPQAIRIGLGTMTPNAGCRGGRSEVLPDWTFRIEGASGTCTIMPSGAGRWTMKSAGRDDLDLLDRPIRIAPGQALPDVQVVFTDRRTELTVDVTDDHGLPTRDYVAVVFPPDKKRWTERSRYVRLYVPPPVASANAGAPSIGPAAPQRRDVIAGLPAGEYYVAVVADLTREGSTDTSTLETLARGATRITLSETAPARVTVHRGPALR